MTVFANFVRCELAADISDVATSFDVLHSAPFNRPPAPSGSVGRLIISDSLRLPTVFEIITYTGTTVVDSERTTLTGVTRGTQGTDAEEWDAGAIAQQDVTADDLQLLGLQEPARVVVGGSLDNSVRVHRIEGDVVSELFQHDEDVVAVDMNSSGEIAGLDASGTLRKFNSDGSQAWGINIGTTVGGSSPNIQISDSGRVYVVVAFNGNGVQARNVLCRASSDGSAVWSVTPSGEPNGGAVDISDNFFYCDGTDGLVRISPDGDIVWTVDPPFSLGAIDLAIDAGSKRLAVADASDIYIFDYGGQELDSFSQASPPLQVEFVSGDRLVTVNTSGDLSLLEVDGTAIWTGSGVAESTRMTMAASDLGYIAYVPDGLPNQIGVVDFDQNPLGSIQGYQSPIRSLAAPKVSPSHCVVYRDNEFQLARLSYDDLADTPAAHDLVTLSTSVVPETPPTGHAYLYFEGTNLIVKWDDGTTDTIATKGP